MKKLLTAIALCAACAMLFAGCAVPPAEQPADTLAAGKPSPESSPLPPDPTLTDYLLYAEQHNAGVQAAFHNWQAAVETIPQARALPDPMLNLSLEGKDGLDLETVMLSQTFPLYGKRGLAADAATANAQAEFHKYEKAKHDLAFRVKEAYYEYVFLKQSIQVTRENIDLLKSVGSVARTRYETGDEPIADLIRIEVEQGKLDNELKMLETMREPMVAKLNAALNRPPAEPLPWPKDSADAQADAKFTPEELLALVAKSNPELSALSAQITASEKQTELARKAYYPDPTFGIGYTNRNHNMENGMDTIVGSIGVNLPIWYGKMSAAVREARERQIAAVLTRDQLANSLSADAQMAAWRYRDAARKAALYHDTLLPKTREAFDTTLKAFEAGKADFTDFIDAQRMLLEFQLSYERALADKAQRLAELEALTGRPLTGAGSK